jgi:precorrin-2 dehydrogenase/sirohydrochlorin ferrochelatase
MMIPVMLDLNGRLTLVIGGGPVGRRKCQTVLQAGGRVRLVCLESRPDDLNNQDLEWRQEPYSDVHLEGVSLVFAAGPPEINARVADDARRRGLWVNVASEPALGDVHLPATVRRGDLLLAISTGGAAPHLARRLRERFEEQFDVAFGTWVSLLAELRPEVMTTLPDQEQRREVFERLTEWGWLDRLREESVDTVRVAMRALIQR